jgi:hypothetical protein
MLDQVADLVVNNIYIYTFKKSIEKNLNKKSIYICHQLQKMLLHILQIV